MKNRHFQYRANVVELLGKMSYYSRMQLSFKHISHGNTVPCQDLHFEVIQHLKSRNIKYLIWILGDRKTQSGKSPGKTGEKLS